ncbi:MAG: hypothetical protein EPN88_08130 [Bacteroidetes bacterium]|nr:MAG: hypothetical protein EPN88_08130 [Bacteroidota bacterium]
MKDNLPYDTYSTFVVRTPLFPFNFLESLLAEESTLYENLKGIIQRPIVAEALFIASPEFYEQLQKWVNGKEIDAKEKERFFQTIYKYLSRMSSRSTPFGLFAGCGVGKSGNVTEVILCRSSEHERHTRLDMSYLCNLAHDLAKNDTIKTKIRYFPNTSIYESGEKLRYIEYRYKKDNRTHHLIEVKNSEFLEMVLKESRNGRTIQELTQLIINKDIPAELSNNYIYKLITNQILISELDPTVTGDEFLNKILRILSPIDQIENIKNILNQTNKKLDTIDLKIGNSPDQYYDIASGLSQLGVDYNMKFLFQTDINLKAIKSSINNLTLHSIKEGIILFNKLTAKYTDSKISQFTDAFTKRYETRECPLLKVLDTETGIGYLQANRNSEGDVSPLIADIVIPLRENSSLKLEWNEIQEFLFSKFLEAKEKNYYEIEFTDDDIKSFVANWVDLPSTFSCMVKLVEAPNKKYPGGRIFMEAAGGSSASQLLGRFCHGNSEIFNFVKEITAFERDIFGEAIIAEIVHLPESRVGNVILRPILQDYEIPFLTSSAVNPEHTITLDDLYISVHNKEIVMRSKRLNKRIIPRLSNAHNYSNRALPVYQFLCDLQSQNMRSSIGFNLGSLLNYYSFRPRVIYKNLIISPASWMVQNEDIISFYKTKDDKVLMKNVKDWREKNKIPVKVLLDFGDNTLFVTFENLLSVKTLLALVKNQNKFILKEFLFNPDNAVVKSEEGVFTNEFVFIFYKSPEKNGVSQS